LEIVESIEKRMNLNEAIKEAIEKTETVEIR
jgi:hypothetical protein